MNRRFNVHGLLEVLTEAFGVLVPLIIVALMIMSPLAAKVIARTLICGGIATFVGFISWRAFNKIFPKKNVEQQVEEKETKKSENSDLMVDAMKSIQQALVVATVACDTNSTDELRKELLVKIINPARRACQYVIDNLIEEK